jgi:hypothetical protein
MGFAMKSKFFALTLVPIVVAGYAGAVCSAQSASDAGAPAPSSDTLSNGPGFFSRHFSTDALGNDVKDAIVRANLAPVSFNKIFVQARDQLTTTSQATDGQSNNSQAKPTIYTVQQTLENAGHGLIRRMQSVEDQGTITVTRFDLTYRGYFPFLTQSVPANASTLPPVVEARKVMRFDTNTDGHINFTYLYGSAGQKAFDDPGQVICDSGKSYSASQLNQAINGQALELDCQVVDSNGIVIDKMKLAYLEKYGVALTLHVQSSDSAIDSSIVDFKVE